MATQVFTITDQWQQVSDGACSITCATADDPSGVVQELITNPFHTSVYAHLGASAPAADTFAFHEFHDSMVYSGGHKVFLRVPSGIRVVKVTEEV